MISIGCNNDDVRDLAECLRQLRYSGCEIAIIVADENFHMASMSEQDSWDFEAALTILKVQASP